MIRPRLTIITNADLPKLVLNPELAAYLDPWQQAVALLDECDNNLYQAYALAVTNLILVPPERSDLFDLWHEVMEIIQLALWAEMETAN